VKRGPTVRLVVFVCLLALACIVPAVRSAALFCLGIGMFTLLVGVPLLAFRVITVIIHETAHAVMTLLVGWRLRRVVIGHGQLLWRLRVADALVDIRLFPVSGFVQHDPVSPRWGLLKHIVICLAGPGAELLILAALVYCLCLIDQNDPRYLTPAILLKVLIGISLWSVAMSAVPHSFGTPKSQGNDAMLILKALFRPRSVGIPSKSLAEVAVGMKYRVEAFEFVLRGLDVASVRGDKGNGFPRHVTGQTLCWALRDCAVESFGDEAQEILGSWGVSSCEDFGQIVFAMVEAGLIGKTETDSVLDFQAVYEFDEAFGLAGAGQKAER
jgi:uncharacterized repeat protein (TIGR04138 family)